MLTYFINGIIYSGYQKYEQHCLAVDGDKVAGIIPLNDIPADAVKIDLQGNVVAPGLIDLQIYGGGGVLYSEWPGTEALKTMADGLVNTGTTTFLLTLATNAPEIFDAALLDVKALQHPAIAGVHFEGPFLNPVKKGAHVAAYIHPASTEEIELMLEKSEGYLKMITLAPEVNSNNVIRQLSDAGIIVSAGHSNASYEEATLGFENGIKAVTHLFNAMSGFHHRNTGLPGAVFMHTKVMASIIADGIHVDFNTLALSKKLMGERLFLITDAVAAAATGPYRHVQQQGYYALPDGTLSGSGITLLNAVKNCVVHAGIAIDEALRMATLYPARLLQNKNIGHLSVDSDASFIVFDNAFNLQQVYFRGQKV